MTASWAASALDWWEEAGVDTIVGETPRDWLNPKAKAATAPAVPAPVGLPDTLDAFQDWLATTPDLPFATPGLARAAPTGTPASGLMILVDMPSPEGGLLAGEAGALFDRMLGAMKLGRETIYLAPLSPIRTPTGAIDAASAARLAELAKHHVALVRPKALLLFGDICGKALLGSAVAGARAKWHALETKAGPVRTMVTIRPEKMLTQPALKALAWADLQMLMEGLS